VSTPSHSPVPSRWPARLAAWTALAAIPLVLFGGSVTTLRAGMAESGWLAPDGYFLWLYPLDMRVRDLGTFVEHHHREIGSLVGLLAIASALAALRWERGAIRWLPAVGLLAVCVQGLIGGLRVLEASPELAFLHGALAQAVFALLASVALCLSPRYRESALASCEAGPGLRRTAITASGVVYAQIVLGAWFRHSNASIALALHVLGAVAVIGVTMALVRALATAQRESGSAALATTKRRIFALVWTQVALGILATLMIFEVSGGPNGAVSVGEAVFATLHVAVGALLLSQTVAAVLWARRLASSPQAAPTLTPSTAGATR
jgi:heme A synthase